MNVFNLDIASMLYFFGGLVRISCILAVVPLFNHQGIPGLVKILTAFALTIAFYPTAMAHLSHSNLLNADSLSDITFFTAKECVVGFSLGFMAKLIFESMTFAFSHVGSQMGFIFSSMFDHSTEATTPTISQFLMIIVTLIFIALDGHYMILRAISESFTILPMGKAGLNKVAAAYILESGAEMFLIALRLSAPVAVIIFFANVAFGIISRSVPQINVIVVSFTVNILVGFIVLLVFLPILGTNVSDVMANMFARVHNLLEYLNG